jgi:hypothetical protein
MPWPLGRPHSAEAKRKLRAAHLRRCADPVIKARWRKSPAARKWWFKDALTEAVCRPQTSYQRQQISKRRSPNMAKNTNQPHLSPTPADPTSPRPPAEQRPKPASK